MLVKRAFCNIGIIFSLSSVKILPDMKKIALIFSFLLIFAGMGIAQTTPATKTTPTTHVKKDGTPDKRFKENKKPPPQHIKKDGTPDMRYKENKAKAVKPTKPAPKKTK